MKEENELRNLKYNKREVSKRLHMMSINLEKTINELLKIKKVTTYRVDGNVILSIHSKIEKAISQIDNLLVRTGQIGEEFVIPYKKIEK